MSVSFTRWVAVSVGAPDCRGYPTITCVCACGVRRDVRVARLVFGLSRSCGCLAHEERRVRMTLHGEHGSIEYQAWEAMNQRCSNPRSPRYHRYGGRGIVVCERWRTFENFLADMGRKPSRSHSLDRIDVDGNYEPGNCRWATPMEQGSNTSRNHYVVASGRRLTVAQWSREIGMCRSGIQSRIRRGWSVEDAVSTPVRRCS